MNGAAFQNEIQPGGAAVCVGAVGVNILQIADLLSHGVIVGPREIQTVLQAAPGVEDPVHAADLTPVVDDKGGAAVAHPGVVGRGLHHADMLGQTCAGIGILVIVDQHGHVGVLGDGFGHFGKGALCGLGPLPPVVCALGPDHEDVRLRLEFTGHTETVLFWGGTIDAFCHINTS